MPVTINGDGSITGLAVGGLPNGTVDADTLASNAVTDVKLASNAVTSDKLASSAVTNAKLASGVITRSELPAGSVLQTVQVTTTTQVENAYSSQQTFLTASITPTDNNNKIMVYVSCCGCGSRGTGTYWHMRIKRDGSLIRGVASYIGLAKGAGGAGEESYPNCMFLDSPGTTNAVSYTLHGDRMGGGDNCYFNHQNATGANSQGGSSMTLMEIAV